MTEDIWAPGGSLIRLKCKFGSETNPGSKLSPTQATALEQIPIYKREISPELLYGLLAGLNE